VYTPLNTDRVSPFWSPAAAAAATARTDTVSVAPMPHVAMKAR
jgi:hypothetical protein